MKRGFPNRTPNHTHPDPTGRRRHLKLRAGANCIYHKPTQRADQNCGAGASLRFCCARMSEKNANRINSLRNVDSVSFNHPESPRQHIRWNLTERDTTVGARICWPVTYHWRAQMLNPPPGLPPGLTPLPGAGCRNPNWAGTKTLQNEQQQNNLNAGGRRLLFLLSGMRTTPFGDLPDAARRASRCSPAGATFTRASATAPKRPC